MTVVDLAVDMNMNTDFTSYLIYDLHDIARSESNASTRPSQTVRHQMRTAPKYANMESIDEHLSCIYALRCTAQNQDLTVSLTTRENLQNLVISLTTSENLQNLVISLTTRENLQNLIISLTTSENLQNLIISLTTSENLQNLVVFTNNK